MHERCKRQLEFKEAFYKACGNPIQNINPVKYNNVIYNPIIEEHKDYIIVKYFGDTELCYHVWLGKEEYGFRRTKKKSR